MMPDHGNGKWSLFHCRSLVDVASRPACVASPLSHPLSWRHGRSPRQGCPACPALATHTSGTLPFRLVLQRRTNGTNTWACQHVRLMSTLQQSVDELLEKINEDPGHEEHMSALANFFTRFDGEVCHCYDTPCNSMFHRPCGRPYVAHTMCTDAHCMHHAHAGHLIHQALPDTLFTPVSPTCCRPPVSTSATRGRALSATV